MPKCKCKKESHRSTPDEESDQGYSEVKRGRMCTLMNKVIRGNQGYSEVKRGRKCTLSPLLELGSELWGHGGV